MNLPPKTRPFPPYQQRERQSERQVAETCDKGHGRLERRRLVSTLGLNEYLRWPGVRQVCQVRRERTLHGRTEAETVYFITSLDRDQADAKQLLTLCRRHWGAIENGLHHVRDTTLDEDRCTIYRGHAPQNLAAMRNAAINWLRQRKTVKLAAAIRAFTRNPQRLFTELGCVK